MYMSSSLSCSIVAVFFYISSVSCDVIDASTLQDKVLFGYQGWFDTPSAGSGWVHWSPGSTPAAGGCSFDLWPETKEFSDDALDYNTDLHNKQTGDPMPLYAATKVQDVHFSWMKDYNIDGVMIQRFLNELSSETRKMQRDEILLNSIAAAEKYGRVVSVMYDISGASAEDWDDIIREDWTYLTKNLSITSSPAYLYHDHKPVLAVWGIGFNDREASPDDSLALINDMKELVYFVGGVPTHWRTGDGDSFPGFEDVYAAMDTLSPWLVGRFPDNAGFDSTFYSVIVPDSQQTGDSGQGYAPVVWPGFSWYNLQGGDSPLNDIPRNAGDFWQHQFTSFAEKLPSRPLFIYGAMFDEFDEGTAMAKAAPNDDALPKEGVFLHLSVDGVELPSDFYLQLAGNNTVLYRAVSSLSRKVAAEIRSTAAPPSSREDKQFLVENKKRAALAASMQRAAKIYRSN